MRTLRWYPTDPTARQVELFAQVAARPDGYRYRWGDKRVWDDLAADLVRFCCGWGNTPNQVPPVLKRSPMLANQLRADFAVGTWALDAE